MRAILLVFLIACAANSGFVNVAAVRTDINQTISRDATTGHTTARYIVSMGRTTNDSAVVYTQTDKTSPRREERWIRDSAGWKLRDARDLAN